MPKRLSNTTKKHGRVSDLDQWCEAYVKIYIDERHSVHVLFVYSFNIKSSSSFMQKVVKMLWIWPAVRPLNWETDHSSLLCSCEKPKPLFCRFSVEEYRRGYWLGRLAAHIK